MKLNKTLHKETIKTIEIDTTNMSIDQVVDAILAKIKEN